MGKTIEVPATLRIDEEDLVDLISTARSDECGCAWWKYDQKEYDAAKEKLKEERGGEPIFHDDVLARILIDGGALDLLDPESDWHWSGLKPGETPWRAQIIAEGCEPVGGDWHRVTVKDIAKAITLYARDGVANCCGADLHAIVENGDFWDADAVIQYAMYGELIYG